MRQYYCSHGIYIQESNYANWDDDCETYSIRFAMCQLWWLFMEAVAFDLRTVTHADSVARVGENIVTNFCMYLTADNVNVHYDGDASTPWDDDGSLFGAMLCYLVAEIKRIRIRKFVSLVGLRRWRRPHSFLWP